TTSADAIRAMRLARGRMRAGNRGTPDPSARPLASTGAAQGGPRCSGRLRSRLGQALLLEQGRHLGAFALAAFFQRLGAILDIAFVEIGGVRQLVEREAVEVRH